MGRNQYPRSRADRVVTEMVTDEGLSNVKHRNVCNNFMLAGMMVTKRGQSTDDDEIDSDIGFSNTLKQLQGDTNACKILEVEVSCDEEVPTFVPLRAANYDKEFTVTEESTVERIYSAFGQEPWYCIRIGKVGFSGDILEDAFEYYNSIVSKQQRMIERAFQKVFEHFYVQVCPSNDYGVQPIKYVRNATVNNPE